MEYLIPNNLGYVKDVIYQDESLNEEIKIQESNASEENRILYLTYIRSLLRLPPTGKIQPPRLIYQNLLKEIAPLEKDYQNEKTPSRLFEFIPVSFTYHYDQSNQFVELHLKKSFLSFRGIKMNISQFHHMLLRFSYSSKLTDKKYLLRTNMRACLNAGIPYNYIPYNTPEEIENKEHTLLTKEIKYEKNETEDDDYWYPSSLTEEEFIALKKLSLDEIYLSLKQAKLPKEIYRWGIQGWRKKRMIIGAWDEDLTWQHLFLEKNARTDRYINMTYKDLSSIVKTIKTFITRREDD